MIVEDYTDQTPMPFGKHIGKALANCPADYLLWLWETSGNGERLSNAKLAKYIRENIEALRMETIAAKQRKRYERE